LAEGSWAEENLTGEGKEPEIRYDSAKTWKFLLRLRHDDCFFGGLILY
jgi:hypothetical protein